MNDGIVFVNTQFVGIWILEVFSSLFWICTMFPTLRRYDTRCYFNVRSKADISRLNLPDTHSSQVLCWVELSWVDSETSGCQTNRATVNYKQEAQISPSGRAMRLVSSNLANCHATVHNYKLLIRQVLTKPMVWRWRFSQTQCVINNVHSTMTRPSRFHCLRCHKQTDDGRVVYITCIPTTCCGEIF